LSKTWSRTAAGSLVRARARQVGCRKVIDAPSGETTDQVQKFHLHQCCVLSLYIFSWTGVMYTVQVHEPAVCKAVERCNPEYDGIQRDVPEWDAAAEFPACNGHRRRQRLEVLQHRLLLFLLPRRRRKSHWHRFFKTCQHARHLRKQNMYR